MRALPCGDRALLLEVDDNATALRLAQHLRGKHDELVDVVPGHRTVLVTWEGARPELDIDAPASPTVSPDEHTIVVIYDGPDLAEVARRTQLSEEEVVARHLAPTYTVGFLGFAPGWGYLLGLDEALQLPRREEPRTNVPAGSVAIAGPYSGVYPRESPGGWHVLGHTDVVLFDPVRVRPTLLEPGDLVRFTGA